MFTITTPFNGTLSLYSEFEGVKTMSVELAFQKNPSFLLGQLVATARLLYEEIDRLGLKSQISKEKNNKETYFFEDLEPHEACFRLMEREIHPYKIFLTEELHQMLLQDLERIYYLKVMYDFLEDFLDDSLYQEGYSAQLSYYSTRKGVY